MSDVAIGFYSPPDNLIWRRLGFLVVAAILHVGLFLAVTLFVIPKPLLPVGGSVPINIVSSEPVAESRPAEEAPEVETATTDVPVAETAPVLPPPTATAPAKPTPAVPTAKPVPQKPVPTPQKPTPTPPTAAPAKPFSLDALQASIDRAAGAPAKPRPAPPGPPRPDRSPAPGSGEGVALSRANQMALAGLIKDYWHPNCEVDGGDTVVFDVIMKLGPDGHAQRVDVKGMERSSDPVKAAAAIRARSAAYQFAPLVPSELYGQLFTITFNAKSACAGI